MTGPEPFAVIEITSRTQPNQRALGSIAVTEALVATGFYGSNGRSLTEELEGGFVINDRATGAVHSGNVSRFEMDTPVDGLQFTGHSLALLTHHSAQLQEPIGWDHRVYRADVDTGETTLVRKLRNSNWSVAHISHSEDFIIYSPNSRSGVPSIISLDVDTNEQRWSLDIESPGRLDRMGDQLVYRWKKSKDAPELCFVRSTENGAELRRTEVPAIEEAWITVVVPGPNGQWFAGAASRDDENWMIYHWSDLDSSPQLLWSQAITTVYEDSLIEFRQEEKEHCGWDLNAVPFLGFSDDGMHLIAVLGGLGGNAGACQSATSIAVVPLSGIGATKVQVVDLEEGATVFESLGGNQWLLGAGMDAYLCTLN